MIYKKKIYLEHTKNIERITIRISFWFRWNFISCCVLFILNILIYTVLIIIIFSYLLPFLSYSYLDTKFNSIIINNNDDNRHININIITFYLKFVLIQFLVVSIGNGRVILIDHITIIIIIQCFLRALNVSVCGRRRCSDHTISILFDIFIIVIDIESCFRWWRFAVVRFNIERWKHIGEEASIECQQEANGFREITCWLELNLGCVHEHD